MKNYYKLFTILFVSLYLSSCVSLLDLHDNYGRSEVHLTQANFKVVDKVSGSATVTYILGFGGNKANSLVGKARSNMLRKVDMIGKSMGIVNETIEYKDQYILGSLIYRRTYTLSAHIVEFTK